MRHVYPSDLWYTYSADDFGLIVFSIADLTPISNFFEVLGARVAPQFVPLLGGRVNSGLARHGSMQNQYTSSVLYFPTKWGIVHEYVCYK